MLTPLKLEVYVAVDDLERAIAFYTRIFGSRPERRTDRYAGFSGGFGVMAADGYAVPVRRGNSAVPTLIVDDTEAAHARIANVAETVTAVTEAGGFRLFMFLDPDGNVVEVAQRLS